MKSSAALDGPVKAIREASPQARHHFTLADQVNPACFGQRSGPRSRLHGADDGACSLPRTNPGNRIRYTRQNGPYTLYMTAGGGNKLPFGNLPRLLMAYVSTEAVRTQSRVLILGSSLSGFMRKLGMSDDSGSPRGDRTRLRNQMRRLFNAHVQLVYEDERGEASVSSSVADRTEFWWNERKPDERVLWDSKIRLGEDFFNEIIRHPVPLNMNTLTALNAAPWVSISTSGSPIGPSRFAARCGSPGVRYTSSSACTRPRPATKPPF